MPQSRFFPVLVQGPSMEPLLPAGSRVVAVALSPGTPLRVGDVILARPRDGTDIIKRITAIDGDRLVLEGDHRERSTDAVVDRHEVIARIRWRYWPMPPRRL